MSERVSTAGMSLMYAVETVKGTMPTTGFKTVTEIKKIPAFDSKPDEIDSTTLAETEWKTSVPGLKSVGVIDYTANYTEDFITEWEALLTAYDTAAKTGMATWFSHVHPKIAKAVFFTGIPSPLGVPGGEVGAMYEISPNITVTGAPRMAVKPTK